MTELNELIHVGSASSSDFLDGGLTVAPMVYDLIDHLPSMQKFTAGHRDGSFATVSSVATLPPVDVAAPTPPLQVAAEAEVDVDPAARELHERRMALITAAQRRTGRRTRLRAAWTAEMSTPDGRLADFGADTNTFVEAMRSDIARAQLRSQRPSMVRYLARRLVPHRMAMSADFGVATIR